MKLNMILNNDIADIQRLKAAMSIFGKEQQLAQAFIQDINLVLEEAVSNVINYGYEDTEIHHIEVNIAISGESLTVEIQDDAKPFNLLDAPDPDLSIPFEDREIGGMGIYMVRTLMDELTYKRAQGKNILIMKKHLLSSSSDDNKRL